MFCARVALAISLVCSSAAFAQARAAAPPTKKQSKEDEAAAAAAAEAEARRKADEERAAADAKAKAEAEAQAAKAKADEAAAAQERAAAQAQALQARGMDARMRALAGLLAMQLKKLPGDHRDQNFAVVPFENVGEEATQRSLGVVVSDLVTTDLARDHHLALVERSQLARVMGELALQQSGAVDDKQVIELGKMAGARALVVGRVADVGAEFVVSARAVDAESGAVLVAEEVKLPKAELVAFSANAVVLRSRSGAMFRSVVLPGWGQAYNDQPVKGALFGAATGGLALSTAVFGGLALYGRFVEYPAAGLTGDSAKLPAAEKGPYVEEVRLRTNAQGVATQVLAGVTAAVWAVNIADAWLSGTDVESLDAALARN